MKKIIALALVVVGVVLLVYGFEANRSLGSGISRVLTGAPTLNAVYLLVAGALALVGGLAGLFGGNR
jgi:hypothetical protein